MNRDVENLTLTGLGATLPARGNTLDNVINGNDAGNVLRGRAGVDTLFGNGGNDTFRVTGASELTGDAIDGGAGTDVLRTHRCHDAGRGALLDDRCRDLQHAWIHVLPVQGTARARPVEPAAYQNRGVIRGNSEGEQHLRHPG